VPFKKGSKAAKAAGRKAANTRRKNAKNRLWIQESRKSIKRGALHKALGIPQTKTIPTSLLLRLKKGKVGSRVSGYKVTKKLKKQVGWALNVRP